MVPVPGIFHLYLKISGSRIRMEADANPGTGSVLKRIRIKITAVQTTNLLEQTVIINKQQHQLSLSTFPLSLSLTLYLSSNLAPCIAHYMYTYPQESGLWANTLRIRD